MDVLQLIKVILITLMYVYLLIMGWKDATQGRARFDRVLGRIMVVIGTVGVFSNVYLVEYGSPA